MGPLPLGFFKLPAHVPAHAETGLGTPFDVSESHLSRIGVALESHSSQGDKGKVWILGGPGEDSRRGQPETTRLMTPKGSADLKVFPA